MQPEGSIIRNDHDDNDNPQKERADFLVPTVDNRGFPDTSASSRTARCIVTETRATFSQATPPTPPNQKVQSKLMSLFFLLFFLPLALQTPSKYPYYNELRLVTSGRGILARPFCDGCAPVARERIQLVVRIACSLFGRNHVPANSLYRTT